MYFNCDLEEEDKLNIDNTMLGIRFEIVGEDPVFYLNKEDLPKLIKHLQTMEDNE